MKSFAKYLSLGTTVVATILIGIYVGKKTNHILAGILFGMAFAILYLYKVLIYDDKEIQKRRNRNNQK